MLLALASGPALGQQHGPGVDANDSGLNRLDLHNGGDILWFINDPFIGSDPTSGNFNGDLYWKVYPRQAIQSCAGARTLWGTEQSLFDLDWSDSAPLWAYLITPSSETTSGSLFPDLDSTTLDGPGVLVPGVSNSGFSSPSGSTCPRPGYVGGWVFSDLFYDSGSGSLIPLMQASDPSAKDYFRADGTVDWSFVHFFPGNNQGQQGQEVFAPSPNGCGSGFAGSATFQWFGSTDGVAPFGDGGENAAIATMVPNPCSTGLDPCSWTGPPGRYGGFRIGGAGAPNSSYIPNAKHDAADLAFLFEEPTLNIAVYTGYTVKGILEPETGIAGLELPIGWSTGTGAPALKDADGGVPGSVPVTLGVHMYDLTAKTDGTSLGAVAVNVDFQGGASDLLIDLGWCLPFWGGEFGLNPANPLFAPTFNASIAAAQPFAPHPDRPEETVYISPQFPITPDPTLLGVTIALQGWTFDLTSPDPITGSSQIVRTNLRDNSWVK